MTALLSGKLYRKPNLANIETFSKIYNIRTLERKLLFVQSFNSLGIDIIESK